MDTLLVSEFHSPQHSDFEGSQFDGSPNLGSPYDTFDFTHDFSQPESHFPRTPSYNGSYQNSPYSIISDLPQFDDDPSIGLFDNPSGITITEEYDPSEYDVPSTSALLTFDDGFISGDNFPHVSITPPMYDQKDHHAITTGGTTDHSSPGSSNGGEDDTKSHASSTSSYVQSASSRYDFAQNFESLRFDSPAWPSGNLPASPPSQKPPSPPQLVIPTSPSPDSQSPPTINAPAGNGGVMPTGPQLHIVPATPVGGGEKAQSVLFQTPVSEELQPSDMAGWEHQSQTQHLPSPAQNQGPVRIQFADQLFAHTGSYVPGPSGMAYGGEPSHEHSRAQQQQFLLPQAPQRTRSMSDTSLHSPIWDTATMMAPNHQGVGLSADGSALSSHDGRPASAGTVNMNDVLPGPSSSNLLQPQLSSLRPQQLRYPSSAGPHQSSFGSNLQQPTLSQQFTFGLSDSLGPSLHPDFLTPDLAAVNLRRSKSDSRGHRQVRSEDYRYSSPSTPFIGASGMLVPPPSSAQQEFIRAAAHSRQFLHPSEPMVSITRGHHRRASSGSRERPGIGGVTGWSSGASSARASPYPSPSASPRPGYGALPDVSMPMHMGMTQMRRTVSSGMMQMDMGMGGGMSTMNMDQSGVPTHIAKVNVTTPSTADASQKRRKQPANFQCPVPGCGSTFTRHFNLKGHLRSHAEEKPFQCKWPGCGKGFARQHDCKRHEQLHLNIRPYPCEGCKKNFARMDALNRHLRSEGGAECRKIQAEVTAPSVPEGLPDVNVPGPPNMKPDPDGPWPDSGGYVM